MNAPLSDHLGAAAAEALRLMRRNALADFNVFAEFVLRDAKGKSIKLAVVHRVWRLHVEFCWANGLIPAILAPFGLGKSTLLTLGRSAHELGQDTNHRIKIISQSDDKATERSMALSAIISSPRYRYLFPHVTPVPAEEAKRLRLQAKWTQHDIFLRRTGFSIDPTIQAAGVLTTGTGGHCSRLFFDDIVDQRNAIDEPALRQKVIENVDNVWMHRLDSDGKALFTGTHWHQADYTHLILDRPGWCVLVQSVSEDFKQLDQVVHNAPDNYPIPRLHAPLVSASRVESAVIRDVSYAHQFKILEIVYTSGQRVRYCEVPRDVYDWLLLVKDKQKFVEDMIEDRYAREGEYAAVYAAESSSQVMSSVL